MYLYYNRQNLLEIHVSKPILFNLLRDVAYMISILYIDLTLLWSCRSKSRRGTYKQEETERREGIKTIAVLRRTV